MFKFIGKTSSFSKYDEIAFLIWITLNSCSVQISSFGWAILSSDLLSVSFVVKSLVFWICDSRDLSNLLKSLKLPFWSINSLMASISFVIPAKWSHSPPTQTFSEDYLCLYMKNHVKNSFFHIWQSKTTMKYDECGGRSEDSFR